MIWKGILAACLAALVLFTVYGGEQERPNAFAETREMVILRKIGHDLLLSGGDSSTRILPLKKFSDNEYQLFFETDQRLSPDSFVHAIKAIAKRYDLRDNFTASIHRCGNGEIVYSTLFSRNTDDSVTPCLGRDLPKDCYYLQFVFDKPGKKNGQPLLLGAIGLVVLSACGYLYYRFGPKTRNMARLLQDHPAFASTGFITIGATRFYEGQQYVEYLQTRTPLTPRETKVLGILAGSANLVVDRDTLQKEVWEKEGVIVTRSLDMFISKLRKKLQPDPTLRISVVHGKGYKLETGIS